MAKMVEAKNLVYFKCPECGHVRPGVKGSDIECPVCKTQKAVAELSHRRMRLRSDGSREER